LPKSRNKKKINCTLDGKNVLKDVKLSQTDSYVVVSTEKTQNTKDVLGNIVYADSVIVFDIFTQGDVSEKYFGYVGYVNYKGKWKIFTYSIVNPELKLYYHLLLETYYYDNLNSGNIDKAQKYREDREALGDMVLLDQEVLLQKEERNIIRGDFMALKNVSQDTTAYNNTEQKSYATYTFSFDSVKCVYYIYKTYNGNDSSSVLKGIYQVKYDSIIFVEIPADSFIMGSNDGSSDEKPIHTVYLDKYYMGKYEITVGQFRKFVNATGYKTDAEKSGGASVYTNGTWQNKADANWGNPYFSQGENSPVVCISWYDANAYCDWAGGLPLPTEAQWEKAARGTDGRKYPWGNSWVGNKCNYGLPSTPSYPGANDGYKYTFPVGSFSTGISPYGCYDMAGNVWEWCSDWYGENYYDSSPSSNPTGPASSSWSYRVLRGGSWLDDGDGCCSSNRGSHYPVARNFIMGFRPAK